MRTPNRSILAAALVAASMSWADDVWLDEPGLWERLSSFHSHPHVTNRWTVASGGVLGRCVIGCSDNALVVGLHGNAEQFSARVALKNATSPAVVQFKIWKEDKLVWASPEVASNTPPVPVCVDLRGSRWMKLEMKGLVKPDQGWGIWGDAKFAMKKGTRPTDVAGLSRQLGILTPPPADAPRINSPTVFGARPGNPVRLYVPVVGRGDIDISVGGLGAVALKEVHFDKAARLLTGVVHERGDYPLAITAKNAFGTAHKRLTLKIGEKIALTPPLGWNSWNAYAMDITGERVRQTADNMVKLGLVDHGWNYLTIDDGWQMRRRNLPADKCRAPDGRILVNDKFGDMRELADYVHARGLKFGIYSSPGVTTCCGYEGSWMHELQDAKTYAEWGVDYLKHDWCSYGKVAFGEQPERSQFPYFLMGRALRASGRDIVLSICQYGNENVSAWGAAVGGQCWRTTKDKFDFWNDALSCIEHQADLWRYAGPGAWNDPDMMLVGKTIWSVWDNFDGTRLTPNEQYSHVSMWAMMCAPMMIGCDLAAMDDFTLSLLTNDEIIELNQDELGAAAAPIDRDDAFWYWAKPMSDGSIAVALINLSPMEQEANFCFVRQGMTGAWRVRDVWRQAEAGTFERCYRAFVPGHATHVIRLWPTEGAGFEDGIADIRDNYWLRKIEKFRPVVSPEAKAVPPSAEKLSVDFKTSVGPIKPVNAVGQPPLIGMDNVSMFHYLTEAGVGYSRLHDVGGAFGKNVFVDIPNVFRDFGADENDPANYDFAFTDMLITNLVAAGVQPFYRLGVTIENAAPRVKAYRVVPPKDYAKWARICEHVVAHYNEGWADGFRLGITYWEIWNEADDSADFRKSFMWQAPFEEYVRLYGVAATHLKRRFPGIKICGYGSCGYYGANHAEVWGEECVDRVRHFMTCTSNFLQTVKREGWPLDMFTYHAYDRVEYCRGQAEYIRKTLDDFGFKHVKVNLDEWLCHSSLIGTAKQATGIAAILAELQNGPVDMAMIYDARCGTAYSPLFDGLTKRPRKAYWAFVAFNELKKLGLAAKRTGKLPENVWATAATDGRANGAILIANASGERVDVSLDLGGWKIVSAKLSDRLSDYRPYDFAGVLPPESFVLIKCEKDR